MSIHGKYLGVTVLPSLVGTPYENYDREKWALAYISAYGQIDGSHHKQWVLDQVARILLGTPVIVSLAKWEGGFKEYRFNTSEPSDTYKEWVEEMLGATLPDGDREYDYDEGIAP
jgi:hypothetical protein